MVWLCVHYGELPSRSFIKLQLELGTQVFGNWHTIKLQEVGDIVTPLFLPSPPPPPHQT